MYAQAAMVVQDFEAFSARAANVVVQDELIDHILKQREVPASTSRTLGLLGRELGFSKAEPIGRIQASRLRFVPSRVRNWNEASLDAVGVVATGVGPEDYG